MITLADGTVVTCPVCGGTREWAQIYALGNDSAQGSTGWVVCSADKTRVAW
ncbi:hypothetical protein GCM10022221_18260 [Actinocorallia aurea]